MMIGVRSWRRLIIGSFLCLVCGTEVRALRAGEPPPLDEYPVSDDDRQHWAFRPLSRPALPVPADAWGHNAIDRFTLSAMRRMHLEPMPQADRRTLIRRLCFDLLGLPPHPSEVRRFLEDDGPDAYQRLIDRLFASPSYGERWAQHWLDLARFAETDGFEHDHVRPHAWRYRDWVISALNQDMPYDRFIHWQVAGDQFADGAEAMIATGFALCGPDMPDINDPAERRHLVLNEMTATVGAVFLALQMGCAQCHDHKYDPVSQADFYRLRAFFDSTVLFQDHPLPSRARLPVEQTRLGRCLQERPGIKAKSYLMLAGDFRRRGPVLEPAFPRIANAAQQPVRANDPHSDYRPQLARWLTRPDHPLTARVIVNRQWQHLFGEALVRTPSDFGLMGDEPRNPELLDWLSRELIESGWSLKQVQRLIVSSATYRQASGPFGDGWTTAQRAEARSRWTNAVARDPDNRFLARQNRRRLDAEAIRDALLACSGRLSQSKGGPGVMPPLPPEIRNSIRKDHWKVSPNPEDHRRRSIYLFVRRNLRFPFLDVFDRPDASLSCDRRSRSNNAPQSLAMLNSDLSRQSAGRLAETVSHRGLSPEAQIEQLYWRCLGRAPRDGEKQRAADFLLAQLPRPDATVGLKSLSRLSLAILNLNEFIYVD